jgi:peptide/nickel transport system substrate-binding protein
MKKVEYINYPEVSSRITALASGDLDIISNVPFDQVKTLDNIKGIHSKSGVIQSLHLITYRTEGVLKDRLLRHALSLAIDRELLNKAFWNGTSIIPRSHQLEGYGDLYFADYPIPEFNQAKAKELLAQSSYKGELITYELSDGYYTFGNEAAEAIVDMWKQIGVNAQVVFTVEYNDKTMVHNWANGPRFLDPAGGLWLLWSDTNPGYASAKAVSWTDIPADYVTTGKELQKTIDTTRRKELARKLLELWDYYCPGTVLYQPVESYGVRDGIDWQPHFATYMSLRPDSFAISQ